MHRLAGVRVVFGWVSSLSYSFSTCPQVFIFLSWSTCTQRERETGRTPTLDAGKDTFFGKIPKKEALKITAVRCKEQYDFSIDIPLDIRVLYVLYGARLGTAAMKLMQNCEAFCLIKARLAPLFESQWSVASIFSFMRADSAQPPLSRAQHGGSWISLR